MRPGVQYLDVDQSQDWAELSLSSLLSAPTVKVSRLVITIDCQYTHYYPSFCTSISPFTSKFTLHCSVNFPVIRMDKSFTTRKDKEASMTTLGKIFSLFCRNFSKIGHNNEGIKMPDEVSNSPSLLQSPSSLFRRSLKASPVKQRRAMQLKKTFKSFSG